MLVEWISRRPLRMEDIQMIESFLDFFQNRLTAELMFWWAGVALPIVTTGAIIFAAVQVKYARDQLKTEAEHLAETKRYSQITAQQAQATLLLNLVDKWNTEIMNESKQNFTEIELREKDLIFSKHKGLSDKEISRKLKEHFRLVMSDLERKDYAKYVSAMRMLNYFETVGQVVRKGYVSLSDIDGLFRGPILDVGLVFVSHIKDDKQNEKGAAPGLYENALYLISEIEKICPQL